MTTREFFTIVHQHLDKDGVMVINVGRAPGDRRMINALASTIETVFPSIHIVDIPDTFNSIIFATVQPTTDQNLINNLGYLTRQGNVNPLLLQTMQVAATNLQPLPPPSEVFTDDHAPVEWITNNMILNFLLSGEKETLK
jgi:hypothetical protein